MPGISRSRNTRSGSHSTICRQASAPFSASPITSMPGKAANPSRIACLPPAAVTKAQMARNSEASSLCYRALSMLPFGDLSSSTISVLTAAPGGFREETSSEPPLTVAKTEGKFRRVRIHSGLFEAETCNLLGRQGVLCKKNGSPTWIRTTTHGSKGRCPTVRRSGSENLLPCYFSKPAAPASCNYRAIAQSLVCTTSPKMQLATPRHSTVR